ncbi:hypothetical protein R83H12_01508 [Fibrobacteria bacterium R8-3-H12]
MYGITCDGTDINKSTPGDKNGWLCEGSFTVAASCPSSCTQLSLNSNGIYQTSDTIAIDDCFNLTLTRKLQAWYYGVSSKYIPVTSCLSNTCTVNNRTDDSNINYGFICATNGNIQVTLKNSAITNINSYINLRCVITLSTTDKDLIYGNTYTVTCDDLNKDIVCLNACSNMQVCYKYNGGSQNCIDGNNRVFSIINGKLDGGFDQKCKNNATIEIMSSPTCSIKCKNSNTYY